MHYQHTCGTTQLGRRPFAQIVKAIAEGVKCKGCGGMCELTMTRKTAEKYGVADSPYIIISDRPGNWVRIGVSL